MGFTFQLLGLPVTIRASFVVLAVVIGLLRHQTPDALLGWMLIATAGVFVHELGHAVAFLAFGERPHVTLHGGGGHTVGGHPGLRQLIVVSLAGPAAGLLAGLLVLLAVPVPPIEPLARGLLEDALFVTIGLSVVNLLPVGKLDGAAALNGLVTAVFGRPAGRRGSFLAAVVLTLLVVLVLAAGRPELAIMTVVLVALMAIPIETIARLSGGGAVAAAESLRRGRYEEALAGAEAQLDRRPRDVQAMLVRATALRLMGRFADAERESSTILGLAPTNVNALAERFLSLRAMGRHDQAEQDLARLLGTPPANHLEAFAQVVALYWDHKYERALEHLRGTLARLGLGPAEAEYLATMEAAVQDARGRPDEALAIALPALARRPDDFAVHELCALPLIQLGRLEDARAAAARALAGAGSHPELLETAGIIERLSGRPERSLELLLASATARPDVPRPRAELAACFVQLGRHAEAAQALDTLPPHAQGGPEVLYARACQAAAAGRPADAAEHLARAARIKPKLGAVAHIDPLLSAVYGALPAAPQPGRTPAEAGA